MSLGVMGSLTQHVRETDGQPQLSESFGDFPNFVSRTPTCGSAGNLSAREVWAISACGRSTAEVAQATVDQSPYDRPTPILSATNQPNQENEHAGSYHCIDDFAHDARTDVNS